MKTKLNQYERFSLNGIKATIVIDTRRMKDNLVYPVKYYISYNRTTHYIRTGIDIDINGWNNLFKSELSDNKEMAMFLKIGFDNIKKYIKELVNDNKFNIRELRRRLDKDGLFKFNSSYIPTQIDRHKALKTCLNGQLIDELKRRLSLHES